MDRELRIDRMSGVQEQNIEKRLDRVVELEAGRHGASEARSTWKSPAATALPAVSRQLIGMSHLNWKLPHSAITLF